MFASLLGMKGESSFGWTSVATPCCFLRQFHDWELEMVEAFSCRIQKHLIWCKMEDRMIWSASRNGKFSVKAFHSFLASGGTETFPARVVWNPRSQ